MKNLKSLGCVGVPALLAVLCGFLLTSCAPLDGGGGGGTGPTTHATIGSPETIHVGDAVEVTFSDLPLLIPAFRERVKPDGSVTLLYSQKFQFAGKNRGDLEAEIRERYVPAYFNNLTVTIQTDHFYFVNGEVRVPNRFPYSGETTVLQAIASAGGFTDFADKRSVRLTRSSGQTVIVDCKAALENSQLDLKVYSGDQITVPRGW